MRVVNKHFVGNNCHAKHLFFLNIFSEKSADEEDNAKNTRLDAQISNFHSRLGKLFDDHVRVVPAPATLVIFNKKSSTLLTCFLKFTLN